MTASNRNKANGNDTLEMKNRNHEWFGSLEAYIISVSKGVCVCV